ncbi:MAG: glycerol-3-phosphate acyltransferase [Spirochaetota bacterium]
MNDVVIDISRIAAIAVVNFFIGAIPFSVIMCWLFLKKDVRTINDGNPGAVNTFKMGGPVLGWIVLILDLAKAAGPVLAAQLIFDVKGFALIPVAIAPVFGHAFSPFLKGKGGKAIATTFGLWGVMYAWGLFPFEGFAIFFFSNMLLDIIQESNGWTVSLASLAISAYMIVTRLFIIHPITDTGIAYIVIAFLNSAVIVYKHWGALKAPFKLRPWGTKPFSTENGSVHK